MKAFKISALTLLVASVLGLTACGGDKAPAAEQPAQTAETKAETTTDSQSADTVAAGEVSIKTADGDKTIPTNATLAVYDMTALQNLHALGVTVQGMPKELPNIDGLRDPNATFTDIGTLFEPNLEALNSLKPQAVFIGSRMVEKKAELENVAPVYNLTVDTNDAYAATKQQLTDFGNIFGKQEQAAKLQGEIDAAIDAAKKAIEGKGNGLAILVNGGKMSAYGKNSRYGFLHTTLGIPMADPNIEEARHGQPITFEYLQKTNPDWLFVLDRSAAVGEEGASAQSVLDNPLVRETNAWKKNQIVYLSPDSYLAFAGYYQWIKDTKIITDAVAQAKP